MQYRHESLERRQRAERPSSPVVLPPFKYDLRIVMFEYLQSRQLSFVIAEKNGWYPTLDDKTPRVVIPAQTYKNTWPYYQARAMDDNPLRYKSPSAPRGDAVVVVHPPKLPPKGVVLSEGPMDALAASWCGYIGIGLMGNQPSTEVLLHASHYFMPDKPVLIIPDVDALDAAIKTAGFLWKGGVSCRVVTLNEHKDLAACPREKRIGLLEG